MGTASQLAILDADNSEDRRYEDAKENAEADPRVQELKLKSDSAVGEEEGREASIAYNRALFRKILEIDGTLSDRVSSIENAILRRIGEE